MGTGAAIGMRSVLEPVECPIKFRHRLNGRRVVECGLSGKPCLEALGFDCEDPDTFQFWRRAVLEEKINMLSEGATC